MGKAWGFQIWAPLTATQDPLWLKIPFYLFGIQLKEVSVESRLQVYPSAAPFMIL